MTIKTRQPAPPLEVKLLDGSTWRLIDAKPAAFEMIVVYRGLHCPICKTYLGDLEAKLPEFTKRGVDVIAISTDSRDRAESAKAEWGLNNLQIGHGLAIDTARDWELFISTAIRDGEPPLFSEPGLFLVKPDGTLFFASRGSAPWGRPPLDQMLRGIDVAVERKMPARGEA
ncbi:MAG: redoxin domain-containing protein [Pseudolabrys sp.]|nr:redoxin domain-containing protein [Pseudolabrys sp.]